MHVIIIQWWLIKPRKTISFCAISLEINHWNVHCFTPVSTILILLIHTDFVWSCISVFLQHKARHILPNLVSVQHTNTFLQAFIQFFRRNNIAFTKWNHLMVIQIHHKNCQTVFAKYLCDEILQQNRSPNAWLWPPPSNKQRDIPYTSPTKSLRTPAPVGNPCWASNSKVDISRTTQCGLLKLWLVLCYMAFKRATHGPK